MAERYQTDIDCVQHEFYRHEHDDDIPPREKTEYAYRKYRGAEH
jgi:hypothetical protein